MMGGSQAHEFMVLNPAGEDVLVLCEACGYAANRQVAVDPEADRAAAEDAASRSRRSRRPARRRSPPSPRSSGSAPERTAKAAFFVTGDGRLVTAIVRGDHEVNETKLGQRGRGRSAGYGPATVEEIKAAGMEPGYGSPIGAHDTFVVVDDLVARSPNLVAGANRVGFHYRNVNVGRDFTPDVVADITNAQEGDPCPTCGAAGHPAQRHRGRQHLQARDEVHRRVRGDLPRRGRRGHPIVMGSYGIGVGRNVACIVEAHHDEKGIVWPAEVAPYAAHLVVDRGGQGAACDRDRRAPPRRSRSRRPAARSCGTTATSRRASSSPTPSCSGMPWILTVSPRSLAAGGVEVTERATGERSTRPIEDVEAMLRGG